MNVLVAQLDGKLPNIALMRIASHHRRIGDAVEFRSVSDPVRAARWLWDQFDKVYASAIFEKSRPIVSAFRQAWPDAVIGGTGIDDEITLESIGIATKDQDYSIYPECRLSIGFTQRGCRLNCPFCVVPRKEGKVRHENTIAGIWRGEPHPREIVLLDNDFFGDPHWADRIGELRSGKFKVSFNQGINARAIGDEEAAALASVDYRAVDYKRQRLGVRRLYTAWDNRRDVRTLFRGLDLLVKHGVRPHHITVYMLIGYWPNETHEAREFRRERLREFGCDPYPMPFVRTRELVGYQRWVIGAYDRRIAWADWVRADYEPRKLG